MSAAPVDKNRSSALDCCDLDVLQALCETGRPLSRCCCMRHYLPAEWAGRTNTSWRALSTNLTTPTKSEGSFTGKPDPKFIRFGSLVPFKLMKELQGHSH